MKIISIIGARPEFVQAAPVSRALRKEHQEVLVHTGQHYDDAMSRVFFEELNLPEPSHHLGVRPGDPGRQMAEMLTALVDLLREERPDTVLVRGDTTSTLAGALAASILGLPLIHVEAGERCFSKSMPEERNRLAVDHLAHLHLCASQTAVAQLAREGISDSVHWVGDVMLDSALQHLHIAQNRSGILQHLGLQVGSYVLLTVHRAANADHPQRLLGILDAAKCAFPPGHSPSSATRRC
jgi:UDP-GlcNAc3NAcA epimerase